MSKKTRRKTQPKRLKKNKASKKNSYIKWLLVASVFLAIFTIIIFYIYTNQNLKTTHSEAALIVSDADTVLMKKMRKMLREERERLDKKPLDKILDKKSNVLPPEPETKLSSKPKESLKLKKRDKLDAEKPSEVADYQKSLLQSPEIEHSKSKQKKFYSGKPRLAIIIDDVSFPNHVTKIKRIPFSITPSILPPTKRHPNSHKLANDFDVYMVHLPLEAISHNSPESNTLMAADSYDDIRNWIEELHKQFPRAVYYNNHTGSKFTENSEAMDRLIRVLKDQNITFLDSRTTPRSVAIEVGKKHGMSIYTRDVFLDNSYEKEAIKKQLKEAVAIAKSRGKAIAIGHPHKNTLSVLENAKPLFEGIEIVYVKDL